MSVAVGGFEEDEDEDCGKATGGGCIGGFAFLDELRLLDGPEGGDVGVLGCCCCALKNW